MSRNLLAIDQGTTSSRAIVFSPDGEILALAQKELKLHYPRKGWVEQDPSDIWQDTLWACCDVLSKVSDVAAIGITNQRETTIIWDRKTGEAIYNAIVWQDRRTAEICARLKAQGHEGMVSAKTGLLLDPYFSATKIAWILDNVEGARAKAEAGDLAFGTVDSFLLWGLTGGDVHATDVTNASRTLLYNIVDQCWDDALLDLFNIPQSLLPEVEDNSANFGQTKKGIFPVSHDICGIAGDQQAALIGQGCFEHGMVKSTYGTGCFALMNVGPEFKPSENRLLTTVAYRMGGEMTYALEGSIFVAGAAIQWLRDNLEFFSDAKESEELARSVDSNNDVYFVPAFTGLGAPYWNPNVRAIIAGLTRESTKAHITRAALEAQGFQTADLMQAMKDDSAIEPAVVRADGGLTANAFVCQFLADMLRTPVEVPRIVEATAWGAACLAGLHAGVFTSLDDISSRWILDRRYEPSMDEDERASLYDGWKAAINLIVQ